MKQQIDFLSIVVPVYNEEDVIGPFHELLEKELKKLKLPRYEIMYVNDGSKDSTYDKLAEIATTDKNVRVLELTRNFGKEPALSAGLHNARGDCIVTLDADGQHPPEKIVEFLEAYKSGYEMVAGVRMSNPDEKAFKKFGNRVYYKLLRMTGSTFIQPRVTDFRAMSRDAVNTFCHLTERRRITRGLLDWMGYPTKYIEFEASKRMAGEVTYSTKKLFFLAVDSILSSSRRPLSISILIGGLITSLSLLALVVVFFEVYIFNDPYSWHISGSAMVGLFILFMVGLVFISQGILALYLARIYEEAQQRPLYIIRRSKSDIGPKEEVTD